MLLAIVIAILVRCFVVQGDKIPSSSMLPTLAVGDHVLVIKLRYGIPALWGKGWWYLYRQPHPGEVIVFRNPTDRSQDYIKRVVAVAGEVVEIRNKELLINGKPRDSKFAYFAGGRDHPNPVPPRDNFGPVVVPGRHLFVLGDNRDQSIDSRYFGFVDIDDIKGRADILYWSWDGRDRWTRWQLIHHRLR